MSVPRTLGLFNIRKKFQCVRYIDHLNFIDQRRRVRDETSVGYKTNSIFSWILTSNDTGTYNLLTNRERYTRVPEREVHKKTINHQIRLEGMCYHSQSFRFCLRRFGRIPNSNIQCHSEDSVR